MECDQSQTLYKQIAVVENDFVHGSGFSFNFHAFKESECGAPAEGQPGSSIVVEVILRDDPLNSFTWEYSQQSEGESFSKSYWQSGEVKVTK